MEGRGFASIAILECYGRNRGNAGLACALAFGSDSGVGPLNTDVVERIRIELPTGTGIRKTAKALGVGIGTAHRVKRELAAVAP
jgi:hypothetical protein